MGELEYYVFSDRQQRYPSMSQEGYEESSPFSKWERLRCEAMQAIAQAGGKVKYAHSEVGSICGEDYDMEQHEIEFLPVPLEDAADQVVIARWVLRMIGYKYGVTISFAPKILVGQAGNGLHIHTKLVKNGTNVMVEENQLSDLAKRAVAGYLNLASSLTAFGNTIPISYLRLVPHQEAPTLICWGDRNRNVLVRVPLGWIGAKNMAGDANPQDEGDDLEFTSRQTVELRCPDGSADIYLLLAGLAVAARYGLEREAALEEAEKLYVDAETFFPETGNFQDGLPKLPASCWESAECLLKDREIYQRDGVFPEAVIDGIVKKLKSFNDKDLSGQISGKEDEIKKLVDKYLHC
jgi:glutamine synthetase